jgi:hypothetical protein
MLIKNASTVEGRISWLVAGLHLYGSIRVHPRIFHVLPASNAKSLSKNNKIEVEVCIFSILNSSSLKEKPFKL